MFSKIEMFESIIAEKNGKFNGVRAELQNEDVPAEIQAIMNQKKYLRRKRSSLRAPFWGLSLLR